MAPAATNPSAEFGPKAQIKEIKSYITNGPTEPPLQDFVAGKLLRQNLETHADKLALVSRWQKKSLTYRHLFDSSRDIAQSLLNRGVRSSDRVIVLAGNSVESQQLFFAVGGIGAVYTIVNPTFTHQEVIAAAEFIAPKAIFIAHRIGYRNNKSLIQELAAKHNHNTLVVQLGGDDKVTDDVASWDEFREAKGAATQLREVSLDSYWKEDGTHSPLCIQFTSGTTGPRKAAILTHHNLFNNAYMVGSRLQMTSEDAICCSPPLFHCFGLVCGPLAAIVRGATAVIPSDVFNADSSVRAASEEKCTVINAVPVMYQAMLDQAKAVGDNLKFRLRTGTIAGSSFSEVLVRRVREELGIEKLAYAFGMTELSCVSYMTDPTKISLCDDRSSVGTPLPHTSGMVVDDDLKAVPPGTRGELVVAGYLMFSEYYKNALKTAEAVVQDSQGRYWLRTGDLVTTDESGALMVVGRIKDMIKKGGENIAPADIEKVLDQHPGITAASVVGVPDERMGETIGVFLQKASQTQQEVNDKSVKLWLRSRIAAHKMPDHIFWIGEQDGVPQELPVNASGKVVKTELTAIASRLLKPAAVH